MDIVKDNFEGALADIEGLLKKGVTFITLDCEFTGIKGRPELMTDTPDERYDKMRSTAEKFQLIQLGLCLFQIDKTIEGVTKYTAFPYNMYVFPEEAQGMKSSILFDIDTANFHKQVHLDFNKWIYEGVPYLSERAEKILLSKLNEERKEEAEQMDLSEEETKKTNGILEDLKKWVQENGKNEYIISNLNPRLRKFMYGKIEALYPQLYVHSVQKGRFDKDIILTNLSEEEKNAKKGEKMSEALKEIMRKSGARRLFQLLSASKVPIIGHNPGYDLMFIFSHFYDELPPMLQEFKMLVRSHFPIIYDTMLLFSDEKIKKLIPEKQSSALAAIYQFLNKSPEMEKVEIEFGIPDGKYAKGDLYHEAGYDAYVTGCCFAKMTGYLTYAELEKHKNLLYAHRAPYHINISGDEILTENSILYVGMLFEGKTKEDLLDNMKDFKEDCYIRVVDEEIIFIGIKKREDMKEVTLKLQALSTIIKLEEWSNYVKSKRLQLIEERKSEAEKRGLTKAKKPSPERKSPVIKGKEESPTRPTYPNTAGVSAMSYQMTYAQAPYYNYYVVSSMPQYSMQYPGFPRPPPY